MKLTKEILKAITETLRKDVREEAKIILSLCSEKERAEFLQNYFEDKGNICCLVLDFAKKQLVEQGKLEQKENDAFGNFLTPGI